MHEAQNSVSVYVSQSSSDRIWRTFILDIVTLSPLFSSFHRSSKPASKYICLEITLIDAINWKVYLPPLYRKMAMKNRKKSKSQNTAISSAISIANPLATNELATWINSFVYQKNRTLILHFIKRSIKTRINQTSKKLVYVYIYIYIITPRLNL